MTKKLHRIAMGYRTHADKLRKTAEMEYELASKVEQCFMMTSGGGSGSYESNNSQSKNNLLLLSTELLEKQRLMEECLAVNDRVVHQLLSTSQRHNELLGYPLKTVTSSSVNTRFLIKNIYTLLVCSKSSTRKEKNKSFHTSGFFIQAN